MLSNINRRYQPKETSQFIKLSYTSGEELDPKKDMHIHGLELEIKSPTKIAQRWLGVEGGKDTHSTTLELTKVIG